MPNKFVLYERVLYQGQAVCIRDFPWVALDQECLYTVRTSDGSYLDVPESQLEATGTFESPLRFDELVEIRPSISREGIPHEDDAEKATLEGTRGVVTGVA